MVVTRSKTTSEETLTDTTETGDTSRTGTTSGTNTTTMTSTTATATVELEATATGSTTTGGPADTSGIKATPAASTATIIDHRNDMPPPAAVVKPAKPARSRRSKASSKRLLAELEVKERLAELELRKIRAEAKLEQIRQEKLLAASSSSEDSDEEDLAPRRVAEWFDRRPVEIESDPAIRQPGAIACATNARSQPEPHQVTPDSAPRPMDVTTLAAALTEAIRENRSTARSSDLPTFSGQISEWLQFKAAFTESAPSFPAAENIARIRRSLKGAALEAVSALLISQPHPQDIIAALERRYGRPDALLISETEKMRTLPRLTDNPRDLCVFASKIANTVATIEILNKPQYLHNPEVLRAIVEKLTPILRNKWYDYAANAEDAPELKKIAEFLNNEADKCAPYAAPENTIENKTSRKKTERTYVIASEPERKKEEKQECPLCRPAVHQLPACPQFKKQDTNERWETAKKNNICYRCLISKHRRLTCRAKPCGHQGCPMRHHHMLHHNRQQAAAATAPEESTPHIKKEEVVASTVQQIVATARASRAYLKIAPVVLRGPRSEIDAFALLDEGSTVTLIDSSLADAVGLDGPTEPMWVQGVSGEETAHKKSRRVDACIRGQYNEEEYKLTDAHTVHSLNFATQSINAREIEDCNHLEGLKHKLTYDDATPKILIGQDNWELIISQEVRKGRRDQLVASRTSLGWVLHGCHTSQTQPIAYCCAHVTKQEPENKLEEMMKQFFTLESLSIEPRKQKSDPELQALKILEEKSRRLPDGRFETGLLWKEETKEIPNNRADAMKRLVTLEKKLDRDENLKKQYKERIDNLLTSNYAERAAAPTQGKTWYLPHFAVCNPEKAKIRVVHDAAATYHGRSLNDMLLPGPDFLQSLPGVIMRFRQHRIAVAADIKEMFMQVKIRNEDRDALRFLWRDDRREGEPDEYRMTSVIFGACSSPCTALYIKNRNAQEYEAQYPQAARAIERNHYMDDYLQSFQTTEEAVQITKEVNFVHQQAGFQLRGWATNERDALRDVTNEREREGTTIAIGGSEIEKTLGLLWDTAQDSIRFRFNNRRAPPEVIDSLRAPTKREALSIIMSVFDPLGLISPVTMPAKRIMQDTWRYKTEWDETIPEELRERWDNWLLQLRNLGNLNIPRCYDTTPEARYELHTMVDASEEAYAAAVYWKITHADGRVKVALAAAKARTTPTKPVSIPRLELQAAVLGVRLAKTVAAEHDFQIERKIYWSDSRTTLAWIRAEPRTFKTFVAHRLAEIEDETKKNEWRWVPTAHNTADDATRATPTDFDATHRWFHGPSFLYEPESTWPTENKIEVHTPEEERKCVATTIQKKTENNPALPAFERFSSWTRLIRTTARVIQFIHLCRRHTSDATPTAAHPVAAARRKRTRANADRDATWGQRTPRVNTPTKMIAGSTKRKYRTIEAEHLIAAEQMLIHASQTESYKKERDRIMNNGVPDKEDRLSKLSVFIDENQLLRLRGRIEAAGIHDETTNPVILHGKHHYTRLYIAHIHEKLHHGGIEIVVNELRQRMYITKIRPAVKLAISQCMRCKLKKAKPAAPSTGDLPAARLAHHVRPFTYTGWDYYGPQEVTVGRHKEKRYVALFTCMTSRAVHLEVAASLSTDSAINALRRFIARRGCPTELWSDNATAFRGADRELREAMYDAAHARRINWRFLPPSAPFMAGSWERMVRTVKEAMKTTLENKAPSDETLLTLLAEAEATVNSRPLTYVPVNPEDPPALTPNMILLGPDCYSPAPGTFTEDDAHARQHWRRAQQLADVFWRRWVREYTPILQHRREPHSSGATPAVGDIVIICDSNLPRNTWPRGRVVKTYPGKDGVVRVVDVVTSRGHILRRPTKKIVVLPV